MRLGIGSYTYTWAVGVKGSEPAAPLTARGLLHRAQELGVDVVQYADNLPLDTLRPEELAALRAEAGPIEIEVGTRGIHPDHLARCLETAWEVGSPILRVVVDREHHQPEPEEVVGRIRSFLPRLERAGVTLAIENHDRFGADTLAEIVRRIDHPRVGVCLDTVNSLGALEGPAAVVDALAGYVVNLHLKDFEIRRAWHAMGFVVEGCPAGQGRLDVPWLLERLRDAGRDPNMIVELWTPPEPDPAATIAKEAAWAMQSIAYLRTLVPR